MTPETLKRIETLYEKWCKECPTQPEFIDVARDVMDILPDLIQAVKERDAAQKALKEAQELHTMQLAGISTATFENTDSTVKDRIDRSNSYWTQAYEDVCVAIDREMRERADKDAAQKACAEMRELLNWLHMGTMCAAPNTARTSCAICELLKRTDLGKGYVHERDVMPLVEALNGSGGAQPNALAHNLLFVAQMLQHATLDANFSCSPMTMVEVLKQYAQTISDSLAQWEKVKGQA